jgi:hypothetical protein
MIGNNTNAFIPIKKLTLSPGGEGKVVNPATGGGEGDFQALPRELISRKYSYNWYIRIASIPPIWEYIRNAFMNELGDITIPMNRGRII